MKKYADRPFALIGVNSDTDQEMTQKRLDKNDVTWRSFWNGPRGHRGPISTGWKIGAWPTVVLIDHEGVIRWMDATTRPGAEELEAEIEELLKAAEAG